MDLIRRSITNSANVTCTDPDGGTGDPDPPRENRGMDPSSSNWTRDQIDSRGRPVRHGPL